MTRLQPLDLYDFTGGLSIRENSFQVADNETPAMTNLHIDPRGGFVTRNGWRRWNDANIEEPWDPRNAELHEYSDGTFGVYVANNNTLWRGDMAGDFTDTAIPCRAEPHMADFAIWGDKLYFGVGSSGVATTPYWHDQTVKQAMTVAGDGTWNDDYTTPLGGVFPLASAVEAHAGYMFVADVFEDFDGAATAIRYPNRIRWSHPASPEDWAQLDFLDVELGGGKINAIKSFQDHLLIFKDRGVWALFGYSTDSWQLVQVSVKSGSPSPTAVAASQSDCYYYSSVGRGGIFQVTGSGSRPVAISERIDLVLSELGTANNVWLDWVADRLLCNLPWLQAMDPTEEVKYGFDWRPGNLSGPSSTQTTTFVFDPRIGQNGAWEAHVPAIGSIRNVMQLPGDRSPIAVHAGEDGNSCLLRLGELPDAVDILHPDGERIPFLSYYSTNWKNAGSMELRKSWRRPRFVVRNPSEGIELRVDSYRNYDNTSKARDWVFGVSSEGRPFWRENGAADPDGFNWDDETKWAANETGSRIVRGGPLGHCRALRLIITPTPAYRGRAWGIDAIELKYINRRFTT